PYRLEGRPIRFATGQQRPGRLVEQAFARGMASSAARRATDPAAQGNGMGDAHRRSENRILLHRVARLRRDRILGPARRSPWELRVKSNPGSLRGPDEAIDFIVESGGLRPWRIAA